MPGPVIADQKFCRNSRFRGLAFPDCCDWCACAPGDGTLLLARFVVQQRQQCTVGSDMRSAVYQAKPFGRRPAAPGVALFVATVAASVFGLAVVRAAAQVGRDAAVAPASAAAPRDRTGQPAASPVAPDAPAQGDSANAATPQSKTPSDPRIEQIHALIAGNLDVAVEPQSLFEVDLGDEAAIAVELVRVHALLSAVEAAAHPKPPQTAPAPAATAGSKRKGKSSQPQVAQPPVEPDAGVLRGAIAALDPETWNARVALDRARLEFYELGAERRAQLLQQHAARQEAARPQESERERHEREVEQERRQAEEEARLARTETERVVAEEMVRLIGIETEISAVQDHFKVKRQELSSARQSVLVWQRRVREAKAAGPAAADTQYDALRGALRRMREQLASVLDAIEAGSSRVPTLGDGDQPALPVEIPAVAQLRERRAKVAELIASTRASETKLYSDQAAGLFEVVTALNLERLQLLPHLSYDKRDAITGFTLAGWDQASSEVRHLYLILRYQRHVVGAWMVSYREGGARGLPLWRISAVAVPWLILIGIFVWGRRRTEGLLRLADTRLGAIDRAERRTTPNPLRRAVRLLGKVHIPLEWLLFFAASLWLLPDNASSVLEVQLLSTVISWVIGGVLVVNVINAVAGGSGTTLFHDESQQGALRLRSLRMVGATVVVFALILTVTARLVGQGTIYSWVYSTCWFAAVPVFLVLVRWWRGEVFERMDRMRKKTRLQQWVLSNRDGWQSFFAAMIAAVQLFSVGVLKTLRVWLSGFDLARRAHAYLFRRELDRLQEGRKSEMHRPLRTKLLDTLHPERPYDRWLSCPADDILERVTRRVREGRGGVIAVVGARGMGKSSLVRELSRRVASAQTLACTPETTINTLRNAIHVRAGQQPHEQELPAPEVELILLDDAHTLVKPVIGGLHAFDQLLVMARASCETTVWVLSLDSSLWPFLKRARDARPMFDETLVLEAWEEEQIGALLHDRCRVSHISPRYDGLLEALPAGSDEIDRLEALRAKQTGYERMLWDHVRGNPALALEAWRRSLEEDGTGAVHVRPLQVPDISGLEKLPDSSLFILRAVLQLAPAAVDDVAQATRQSTEQVLNAFRFGQTQGYFVEHGGRVSVSWAWLRSVIRLLERRHLLVSP